MSALPWEMCVKTTRSAAPASGLNTAQAGAGPWDCSIRASERISVARISQNADSLRTVGMNEQRKRLPDGKISVVSTHEFITVAVIDFEEKYSIIKLSINTDPEV